MAAPDIGVCISAGINGMRKNPVTHIVATILISVVGGVSAGLLTGPMVVGYMRMLKVEEEGGKIVATNTLGENVLGSPAISGDSMFVRSTDTLWKISRN